MDVKWEVSNGPTEEKRIEYVPKQRTNDGMSRQEKEGIRVWNLMVDTLRKNGLMKGNEE